MPINGRDSHCAAANSRKQKAKISIVEQSKQSHKSHKRRRRSRSAGDSAALTHESFPKKCAPRAYRADEERRGEAMSCPGPFHCMHRKGTPGRGLSLFSYPASIESRPSIVGTNKRKLLSQDGEGVSVSSFKRGQRYLAHSIEVFRQAVFGFTIRRRVGEEITIQMISLVGNNRGYAIEVFEIAVLGRISICPQMWSRRMVVFVIIASRQSCHQPVPVFDR